MIMDDNKKVELVFEEEEGLKDRGEGEKESKTNNNTTTAVAEKIRNDSASSRDGPRRLTDDDDDDSSVGSSSSVASSSSEASKHSQSSSSCSSTISLPTGCLRGVHDKPGGCDEAELRAREKRCMEIMRLSKQVKKAERARAKAANIKPLTWAEPTFECGPTAADVNAASNLLGKRKEHPDQESPPPLSSSTIRRNPSHPDLKEHPNQDQDPSSQSSSTTRRNLSPSHRDLMQGQVVYNPIRQPSEEEVEWFVKFAKKNMP
jgi:hypothetical protein